MVRFTKRSRNNEPAVEVESSVLDRPTPRPLIRSDVQRHRRMDSVPSIELETFIHEETRTIDDEPSTSSRSNRPQDFLARTASILQRGTSSTHLNQ